MSIDFLTGFVSGVIMTLLSGFVISLLDAKVKEWEEFRQYKKDKSAVVDAHFVERPESTSQALVKKRTGLTVYQTKTLTRR